MVARNALVLINGQPAEMPAGDSLNGASGSFASDREVSATKAVGASDSRVRSPFTINYIKNPDAEIDTSGWSTYADAAAVQPIDGAGAGASSTWTRYNGTYKSGAYNFLFTCNAQGDGVAYDFTIDSAHVNRSLTISGSAYIGAAASDVVSLWVIDVTAGTLCPISSGNKILATGEFALQFTTSGNTSYRLCVHVHKASPGGATVQLDNFYVGPTYLPSSPAMSDWQDGGTITITATATNPTKGTVVRDKVWWRRVGDSAEIRVEYEHSAAGAAGSGDYLLTLPAGLTIDTTKVIASATVDSGVAKPRGILGTAVVSNGVSQILVGGVRVYDSNRVGLVGIGDTGIDDNWRSAAIAMSNTAIHVTASFIVPIAGWSGTTAVQPGYRYLWAQRFAANAVRVTTTPSKPGEYRSLTRAAGGTTYSDAAPTVAPSVADGILVKGGEPWGTADPTGEPSRWQIYVGPGKVIQQVANSAAGRTGGIIVTPLDRGTNTWGVPWHYDAATGVVTFQKYISASATSAQYCGIDPSGASSYNDAYIDFLVADDPVPVALAPAVHVEASSDAGQTVTLDVTNLQYEDKSVDTHGAWDGSTFTAPVSGIYSVSASSIQASGNTSTARLILYKNGSAYLSGGNADAIGGSTTALAASVKLAAGDTLTIRSNISTTRQTDSVRNRLSITLVGGA